MPTTLQAKERKKQRKQVSAADMDKAWNASVYSPPKYSMRARTSFAAPIKSKMVEADITSGPIDMGAMKNEPPKWTMRTRTSKTMQMPGQRTNSVPGPGTYKMRSSMDLTHPANRTPGHTKFSLAPRFPDPDSD